MKHVVSNFLLLLPLFLTLFFLPTPSQPKAENNHNTDTYFSDLFSNCTKEKGQKVKECLADTMVHVGLKHPEHIKPMLAYLEKRGEAEQKPPFTSLHRAVHDLGMELYYKIKDPYRAFDYCGSEFRAGCYHSVVMSYFDEITKPSSFSVQEGVAFCEEIKERFGNTESTNQTLVLIA